MDSLRVRFRVDSNLVNRVAQVVLFVEDELADRPRSVLDCGGKRSATPLWLQVLWLWQKESAVAAALCRRAPNRSFCLGMFGRNEAQKAQKSENRSGLVYFFFSNFALFCGYPFFA